MTANPPKGIGSRTQAILVGIAYGLGALGTLTTVSGMLDSSPEGQKLKLIIGVVIIIGGILSGSIKEALKALPGT